MLARPVINRYGRRFRGYFPSHRMGRMVAWESLLELDAILLLEFSWGVLSYREQPALIQYYDGDKVRDYYPDFELVLEDGSLLHLEVKPSAELAKPAIQAKYSAIAAHYQSRQQAYRIVTEQEIQREPLLGNVRTLAYLTGKKSQQQLPDVQAVAKAMGSDELPFLIVERMLGREMTLRLIARGTLRCDLAQPLSGETPVFVVKGGLHATYLL